MPRSAPRSHHTSPPLKPTALALNRIKSLGPDLLAGVLCALMTLAYASSFATLIFGGVLAPFAHHAVLAGLVGSCLAISVLSWRSSFYFAMGGPDSNPSAILAATVATIAAEIIRESGANTPELLPTVFMFLFVSASGCGLLLYLVGERRWGRYVRYIPYQVIGGFLVGTGYLLLAGGWKMLTGASPFHTTAAEIETVPAIAWTTAALVAAALLILMRVWKHFLVIPLVIFTAVILFHLALLLGGNTLGVAQARGLLLEPFDLGGWSHPFNQPWGLVRWDFILAHANDFAAMTMVVIITILLNATSLDHATGCDADFDRELKALGLANLLTGLAGGLVSVNSFNRSLLNLRAGARSPWAGRLCVALVAALMIFSPQAVGLLPKPVLTGLILYLGLSLLLQWLWDGRRGMPASDYAIMLAILGTVVAFGIVPGVAVGILISVVGFVVNLSRSTVVKHRFTSATHNSNVERPMRDVEWLRAHGERLQGVVLHGYLFFGTSSAVLDELRGAISRTQALALDFWHVRGIDTSSVMVLRKLIKLATDANVQVIFTGVSAPIRERMLASGLDVTRSPLRSFPDLDHGLEWAEETLLTESLKATSLAEVLGGLDEAELAVAGQYFESSVIPARETFIRRGAESDLLYIVLDGRVSIYLAVPGTDYRKRLRSYGPGTIVGEMGFYSREPRSADISADIDTRLARITRENFTKLEAGHPFLAGRLHRLVVHSLAARLRTANNTIADLL